MTKEEEKKVTIIIALYNCDKYLDKCIESLVKQTYKNLEIIICDDKSTDDSYEIACYWSKSDKRIKVIRNNKNMKAGYTRNQCIKLATGDYIAIQDADDYSDYSRIEKQVKFLNIHHNVDFVSTGMHCFNNGTTCKDYVPSIEFPVNKDFLNHLPFAHATTLFRIETLKKVNGYSLDKKLYRVEDFELFFKLYIAGYRGANMNECLYYYYEDENDYSKRKYRYRVNEFFLRYNSYKKMKLLPKAFIWALKPLFVGLIPQKIINSIKKQQKNF